MTSVVNIYKKKYLTQKFSNENISKCLFKTGNDFLFGKIIILYFERIQKCIYIYIYKDFLVKNILWSE